MKHLLPILFLLTACTSKPANTITISIKQDHVEVKGIPATELYGLKTDSLSLDAWQSLFPVFKMPADTELRNLQPYQPGKYKLIGQTLTFTPDTPFVKDSTYFARYYRFADGMTSTNIIIDKRKPGEPAYTELIFKY